MIFNLEGLTIYFPYEYLYPEQYEYMIELKRAIDNKGHGALEMPTGTGKTITLLSLITSYQLQYPERLGKLIYCTRTVPEMEKVLAELKELQRYRELHCESIERTKILAIGLSSRKNLCVNVKVSDEGTRESVDARCRNLTASWIRTDVKSNLLEEAENNNNNTSSIVVQGKSTNYFNSDKLCEFYEDLEQVGTEESEIPAGVYTLQDLKEFGREKRWCPYFLARQTLAKANVVVYNYQYLLDPKVAGLVSEDFEENSIVVFDEAHNIDNVCIEALSVNLRSQTLDQAQRNITTLNTKITEMKQTDKQKLIDEYDKLVNGLTTKGAISKQRGEDLMANPVIAEDILANIIPGNIRRAEHFVAIMRRFVEFLRHELRAPSVVQTAPRTFIQKSEAAGGVDANTLKFCYDRLTSLLKTLMIVDTEEFTALSSVADFATLIGTYDQGFTIIMEPYDERYPHIPDPVLQLACLDASLAIAPVFKKYQSVFITSGTLSPIDLYPRLLKFTPMVMKSLMMTLTRKCLCPMVITRGADQQHISSKFDMREDPNVIQNYGKVLVGLAQSIPDGIVAFFVSYSYMENIISKWHDTGILREIMQHKLIFMETQDVVETSLALDNYRRACNAGRGAVFLSVARGKVAEGIDFDRHYGRAVIMYGVPYQYTLSRILRARLEYLRETLQIREQDFLTFDAIRQASQCIGRVIRSKADYGLMVFADKRYNSHDKRSKLPKWISNNMTDELLNLSTDMALTVSRAFMRQMSQPYSAGEAGKTLFNQQIVDDIAKRMGYGAINLKPPTANKQFLGNV
jgi:DNA excision repair protein ERCC-2